VISVLSLESWDVTGKKLFLAGKTIILPVFFPDQERKIPGNPEIILSSIYSNWLKI
jgi:hypothetical protein